MRINAAGNVGIGITNPAANHKLHIKNTETANFRLERNKVGHTNTQNGYLQITAAESSNLIYSKDLDGNDKDFVIDGGNVGIGTTNPGDKKLYVNGPIQSTSSINYKDMEIVLPGGLGVSRTLFVVEPDSHYMVTVTRGDTPSQLTTCMVTTASSIDGDAADVNIHEITNSGHYSIIYETSNKSIRWKNDTSSSPPKINASVLKLK